MVEKYPESARVVKTPEVDFLINFVRKHIHSSEFEEYFKTGRINTSDKILAEYPSDVFSFECMNQGLAERARLSQVDARVLSTGTKNLPLVVISDIGWPRDHPERQKVLQKTASSLPVLGTVLTATIGETPMTRRTSLRLGLAALFFGSLGAQQTEQRIDESKLWQDNPYIIDGRSAYRAQVELSLAPVLKKRQGLERKLVWAGESGNLHEKGLRNGYGLPELLQDRTKRKEILERDGELILGAIKSRGAEELCWPWVYVPDETSGKYKTIEIYRPDGETEGGLTKYTLHHSWSPK